MLDMTILESWEGKDLRPYVIVQHSKHSQGKFRCKQYEVMWGWQEELCSFGGSPGMGIADFDSVEEAREFLMTGFERQDENPDVWLEMVELTPDGRRRFDVDRSRF